MIFPWIFLIYLYISHNLLRNIFINYIANYIENLKFAIKLGQIKDILYGKKYLIELIGILMEDDPEFWLSLLDFWLNLKPEFCLK